MRWTYGYSIPPIQSLVESSPAHHFPPPAPAATLNEISQRSAYTVYVLAYLHGLSCKRLSVEFCGCRRGRGYVLVFDKDAEQAGHRGPVSTRARHLVIGKGKGEEDGEGQGAETGEKTHTCKLDRVTSKQHNIHGPPYTVLQHTGKRDRDHHRRTTTEGGWWRWTAHDHHPSDSSRITTN